MERKESRPRRLKVLRSIALATKGATSLPLLVLVVLGLLVFMETRIFHYIGGQTETDANACTPKVINANNIEYHSGHRYYSALKGIGALPPPVIREEHARLCSKINRYKAKYEYCLPISGRKDSPFCTAADRTDLLNIQVKDICYASVLHMLLVEVYEELQAKGGDPFLVFGSLLGAVRNGSMIPFTEDVDIGYVGELEAVDKVKLALRKKGYHMFYMGIWRVCVAPTHPLAGHLYDPELPITENFAVPYVDLYMLKPTSSGDWDMQELEGSNGRLLPDDKVQPFSQVTVNGMPFDTVHDPKFFLREAYGDDYMTPKPREEEDGSNRREKPPIR